MRETGGSFPSLDRAVRRESIDNLLLREGTITRESVSVYVFMSIYVYTCSFRMSSYSYVPSGCTPTHGSYTSVHSYVPVLSVLGKTNMSVPVYGGRNE